MNVENWWAIEEGVRGYSAALAQKHGAESACLMVTFWSEKPTYTLHVFCPEKDTRAFSWGRGKTITEAEADLAAHVHERRVA